MAHVVLGRVVLGSGGGVTVEGARADVLVTGPDGRLRERAVSASDGRFVVVYRYANVETVTFRLTSPTGVLIEQRELPSPGDNQETTDDLGDIAMPDELGARDLVDSTPALPARPRISGRVVDRGGECSIHCLQVLIEGILTTAPEDAEHVPLAVARTDRTGRFFVDYTGGPFRVARARIPGLELPIPLPVTASGLITPEPLLVIDLPEVEHAHETVGCECGSADVPRLPGQEQLAEDPSTYSADLGAGCVSFTTPNRAIEEYDFWNVVRTSQPTVSGSKAGADSLDERLRPEEGIPWDADPDLFQARTVAHGHLLRFRQIWYADGYSLGDLLYSLPLAPGQKKLVSVVEWERQEAASRTEDTAYSESLAADLTRDRDITEVILSALTEQSRGASTASTWGIGTGSGGAGNGSYQGFNFGALFGVSGGHSRADSSAWQASSRSLASTSMNHLRDRVLQSASAVRGVRSTVVNTVGASEAVRAETEVVANHNRCHAMTIQYFEVLRHFHMRHELAEVRECLFVPLPMTTFNAEKALHWRDQLTPYLRRPELRGSVEALERVDTDWAHAPAASARYADEALEDLSGEFDIEFQAYPPPLPEPDETSAAAQAIEQSAIAVIASLFFPPVGVLSATIVNASASTVAALKAERSAEQRHRKFHRDVMPRFAARFVNDLRLQVEQTDGSVAEVDADFTLISPYQPDRRLVVSFTAPVALQRTQIRALRVESAHGVPDAVRCLLRGFRGRYSTATFTHPLTATTSLNDDLDGPRLVPRIVVKPQAPPEIHFDLNPSTVDPVRIKTPLTTWERRSPRDEDRRLAARLLQHLNANLEYYHHAIWWTMDPNRRYLLLDGYAAPNGSGRSLAQVVENSLIGIVGNSLVMPVASGVDLDPMIRSVAAEGRTTVEAELLAHYAPDTPVPPARISLPTKGVFAEAVLGACNSCERIDDSRFWRWEEHPLEEPPAITAASTASRRSDPPDTTPTPYPTPIVNVQNAPAAPAPTDLAGLLQLLGQDAFRDLTGLAATQANAAATYRQNLETALAYGKEASVLAQQAGMLAAKDRAVAAIDQSEDQGQITGAEARELRMSVLRKVAGEPADDNAHVARAQKLLTLVDEAASAGQVDEDTRNRLATTILEELTAAGAANAERRAAAGLIRDMSADRTSEVTVDADGSTAVRTHDDLLGRSWDEHLLHDLVRPASWAIPSYQPDEIFLTDDEVQAVLRFFYTGDPAILGHLDGTVIGHKLRSAAQGMLLIAAEASRTMSWIASIFRTTARGFGAIRQILQKVLIEAVKQGWWKDDRDRALDEYVIYETVRTAIAGGQRPAVYLLLTVQT